MSDLTWTSTREKYSSVFAEYPGTTVEAAIVNLFEIAPTAVIRVLDETASAYQRGDITSGWGIAHSRLTRAAEPIRDVTVDTSKTRAKKIRGVEAWIKHTGCQIPTEDEYLDELFGDRGYLRDHKDDEPLRRRMLSLYAEARALLEPEPEPALATTTDTDWE